MMDKFYFPETERQYTDEGYLIVPATISRPGTQTYKAIELVPTEDHLPMGLRPEDPITVYRPPEEVFKAESVNSFKNIAVTNNHPPEFLNSKNYKKYSVGIVLSDVETVDGHVKGTIKITDYETINEIKDGKVDISAGYHSNVYFEEGETPEGEPYQAIQKDISGNHVAVVMRGRAGSEVKLADGLEEPSARSEKLASEGVKRSSGSEASETLGGTAEEEEEEFGADGVPGSNTSNVFGDKEVITESTDVEDGKIKDMKELTMKLEDAIAEIKELTNANEKLSSQVLDQAGLDSLVEDRMTLIDACSKLVDGMEYIGKSNLEIKKEVLTSKMAGMNLEDKSSDYVNAAFDVMKASLNDTVEGKHDEDVYGKDLSLEDGEGAEGAETPKGEDKPADVTKNVHEGTNPDDVEGDVEEDEPDKEIKVKDSVSVLDSAFGAEIKQEINSKAVSPYEQYCAQSRDAWKKK
jgi:hypothetical protein